MSARWRQILQDLQEGFPSPWKEAPKHKHFENSFKEALAEANQLRHNYYENGKVDFSPFLGSPAVPDYSLCKLATLREKSTPHSEVIKEIIQLFDGMPNWGHPMALSGVNPPANTASIIGASLSQVFNADLAGGEYSWNVAKAEIESGAMLAELLGWDPAVSGGIYTFGGTGSYLYALKLALTTVLGESSRKTGIREEGQLLVSAAGHYAQCTCGDWTGLGTNNVRQIAIDAESRMDIQCLKNEMKKCQEENKPIVMIVCTMGTTDAFAIDAAYEIRELIDSYQNAKGYPQPFFYADAVIGWPWMTFKNYDMRLNHLMFPQETIEVIELVYKQIAALTVVDAMGIDFHKTGWSPFASSFFLVKDYQSFTKKLARPDPPYLQKYTNYNPFMFTLETTRGASGALAGWASLKFFGYEGYQVMLGRMTELMMFFREVLGREKNMVCINPGNYGFVTLFRIYPPTIDAKVQYDQELNNTNYRDSLHLYNEFQAKIARKLFAMLHDSDGKVPGWEAPPYTSITLGYRMPLRGGENI